MSGASGQLEWPGAVCRCRFSCSPVHLLTCSAAGPPPRPAAGWTLLECLLVVAIMGMIFASIAPLIHAASASYDAADPRIQMAQEARFALGHLASALRQARAVTGFTDNGAGAASLAFLAHDGTPMVLARQAGSRVVQLGPAASPGTAGMNCTGLAVRCYTADGTPLAYPLTNPGGAAAVEAAITVADPRGKGTPATFTTRVALERPRPTVVINEVMYSPPAALGSKSTNRWIELYNPTSGPVDVAGWYLWNKNKDEIDTLSADTDHGGSSSVIPAGGYAVITDRDTQLYNGPECIVNGSFESGTSSWSKDFSQYDVTSGAPVGGKKIEIYYWSWAKLWQTFNVPDGHATFSFWEMDPSGSFGGRVLVNLIDQTTGITYVPYDGPTSETWTQHTFNVSYLAGHTVKIEFKYCPWNGYFPRAYFDGISITVSAFPKSADCVLLRVNDNELGNNLDEERIYIGRGQRMEDGVIFLKAWAGDGDGSTLSRTSPYAPPTEQTTWFPGIYGGTAGLPNE